MRSIQSRSVNMQKRYQRRAVGAHIRGTAPQPLPSSQRFTHPSSAGVPGSIEVIRAPGDNAARMRTPPAPEPPKPGPPEPDLVTEAPDDLLAARTQPDREPEAESPRPRGLLEKAPVDEEEELKTEAVPVAALLGQGALLDEDLPTEALPLSSLLRAGDELPTERSIANQRGVDLPFDSPRLAPPAAGPPARSEASEGGGAAVARPWPSPVRGAGDRLRQYELLGPVRQGDVGNAFLAQDSDLGRQVVLKLLVCGDPMRARRLLDLARAAAHLVHPNAVRLYEADEAEGIPFLAFEPLRGQPLARLLAGRDPMPPRRAAGLIAPVVRALCAAHAQGVVHGDLKPDNVFITEGGAVKVLDFGIAAALRGERQPALSLDEITDPTARASFQSEADRGVELTRLDALQGTAHYLAPEQWGSGAPADGRADLWSVGALLFRMLAGRHPFHGMPALALSAAGELGAPMPRLAEAAPGAPAALAEIVDRCLQKRPSARFPDAPALLRALESFLAAGDLARPAAREPTPGGDPHPEVAAQPPAPTPRGGAALGPYPGLAAFGPEDAGRFFGRQREIRRLIAGLRELPVQAVVGPSGSGKTSLIRAGVIPALQRSGEPWDVIQMCPGRNPVASLAAALAPAAQEAPGEEGEGAAQRLAELLRAQPGRAATLVRERARRGAQKILFFADQFEELYALEPDPAEREVFTACLAGMADGGVPVRILIGLRSDFWGQVEGEGFKALVERGLFEMPEPPEEDLREAIVRPAQLAGYRFEFAAIVDDLVRQASRSPAPLPLLQLAAGQLWERRDRERRLLTEAGWTEVGGVAGALARHADAALGELPRPRRALARAVLLRLVGVGGAPVAAAAAELNELSPNGFELGRVLDHLIRARVLVARGEGGEPAAELAHESLIRSWPALRRWLDEGGEGAAFSERLRSGARKWQASGADPRLLWRGEEAARARRFAEGASAELPDVQRQFLDAVVAQAIRWEQRRRALARAGVIALAVLAASSALALAGSWRAQREALLQAEAARRSETMALAEAEAARRLAASRAPPAADRLAEKRRELAEAVARLRSQSLGPGVEARQAAREQVEKVAAELEALLELERDRVNRVRVEMGSQEGARP